MKKPNYEIMFNNIDYALIDLDLQRNSEFENLEEMNKFLKKNVTIRLYKNEFENLLEQMNEITEKEALFNLFVKKRKWLLKSADVSIERIKFNKNIVFAEQYIAARTINAMLNNEENFEKIIADVSAIFDNEFSLFLM